MENLAVRRTKILIIFVFRMKEKKMKQLNYPGGSNSVLD